MIDKWALHVEVVDECCVYTLMAMMCVEGALHLSVVKACPMGLGVRTICELITAN